MNIKARKSNMSVEYPVLSSKTEPDLLAEHLVAYYFTVFEYHKQY